MTTVIATLPDNMADPKIELPVEGQVEESDSYPQQTVVIPAMAAAYLAVFLIALVWQLPLTDREPKLLTL